MVTTMAMSVSGGIALKERLQGRQATRRAANAHHGKPLVALGGNNVLELVAVVLFNEVRD